MNQSEISQEIVNSTHRLLEQIKALEVCPNTPNGVNHRQINYDNQKESTEVMDLISSLQTDQSEELLRDIHNWSDTRVHNYETYEKPLLDQMEINQKTDSNIADEFSPRLEVNINNFDNKLIHAKEAVANLAESLIKQRCIDSNESNININEPNDSDGFSSNILQFQSTAQSEQKPTNYDQSDDYEQLRLREAHLVQIVGELSNEVETMSNEAVSRKLEILNMQHEAEQKDKELKEILANNKEKEELILTFSNRIEELEQKLAKEEKKVEELLSKSDTNEIVLKQYSEISSQTNIEVDEKTSNNSDEQKNDSVSSFRIIDNFSFDIESNENENKVIQNTSIRTIENFSIDIECDEQILQKLNETTNNHKQETENKEIKQFQKFGEVSKSNNENKNGNENHFNDFINFNSNPNSEFESLLRMENEECPGSEGRTSVLPLGIKPRRISTEKGKRNDYGSWTFRLFFKDKEGGAVIVDADVARRDEKTGVMLLRPTDVRTVSSPNKANRLSFIEPSVESTNPIQNQKEKEVKTTNEISNDSSQNQENEQNLSQTNTKTQNNNKKFTQHNTSVSQSIVTNKNSQISGENKETINAQNQQIISNKPLTRHQEIMRRILEIHERQLAKIKAARAAAAAYSSTYFYCFKANEIKTEQLQAPEASIINLNKSVERQIRFDKAGKVSWSNFNSKPQHLELPGAVVGSALYPRNGNGNANANVAQNPRILARKNRKVVVPNQPKMKSPRRPFIL